MRVPKDVLGIAGAIVFGVVALWLTRDTQTTATEAPARGAAEVSGTADVLYRVEGGHAGLRFVEVGIDGPGRARVRYQPEGGAVVAVPVAWTAKDHARLLRLLADVQFFDTDEVGRRGYYPDMAKTTLRAKQGELWNEIVIDGHSRPNHDLSRLVAALDRVRLSATPEPLMQGD